MIPVSSPIITKKNALDVFNSITKNNLSGNSPEISLFEKKLSKHIGRKFGVAVSSGTAALEIAIKSLNLEKKSEVIVPNFSIVSNLNCILKENLTPVFIDAELKTWNMNLNEIYKKITAKTKAIIVTHIYGYPINLSDLENFCNKKNIYLIEDAAEMIGHKIEKRYCGAFGDISVFSFYANKHLTTGEGGMIFTNKKKFYNKFIDYRNLSFGSKNRYNHKNISWNYRMSSMQAALGISQLKKLNNILKKKIQIGSLYYNKINNINLKLQEPEYNNIKNIYWVVGILIKNKKKTALEIIKILKNKNIQCREFFFPLNKQKFFKKINKKEYLKNYPVSNYLSKYGFYIPSGPNISIAKINKIAQIINKLKF